MNLAHLSSGSHWQPHTLFWVLGGGHWFFLLVFDRQSLPCPPQCPSHNCCGWLISSFAQICASLRQALGGLRSGFEDGIGQDVSSKGQRPERVTSNGRCEPDYVLRQVTTEKMTSNRNSVELNLERKVRLGIWSNSEERRAQDVIFFKVFVIPNENIWQYNKSSLKKKRQFGGKYFGVGCYQRELALPKAASVGGHETIIPALLAPPSVPVPNNKYLTNKMFDTCSRSWCSGGEERRAAWDSSGLGSFLYPGSPVLWSKLPGSSIIRIFFLKLSTCVC